MINFNGEILYENIKALCSVKNITITTLEKNLGFSVPSISKWKDGNPTIQKITQVANYLDVSIDFLLSSTFCSSENLELLFIESLFNKTKTKDINWCKADTNDTILIKYNNIIENESDVDPAFDDDLQIYKTCISEKDIYCIYHCICDDFSADQYNYFEEFYHVAINHENILEFIGEQTVSKNLFKTIINIEYYEPRKNSLNEFMSDFIKH